MNRPFQFSLVISLLAASACDKIWIRPQPMAPIARQATYEEPSDVSHLVNKGETLFKIAKRYTGKGQNWKALANYNTHIKPNALKPGQEVFIPSSLLASNAIPTPEINGSEGVSYARFSLKADSPALARASTKTRAKKKEDKKQETITALPKAARAKLQTKSETPKARILPIEPLADAPMAKAPIVGDKPAAVPVVRPIETAEIAPPVIIKRKAQRVITAKTHIDSPAPKAAAIIAKKSQSANKGTTLALSEPVEESQSSRSSFYSCMADKCSLHSF